MSVLPKEGGVPGGRRWLALLLAGIAGFIGTSGATSPATVLTILAVLFVAVFLIALAYSMLTEPSPIEPAIDEGTHRQGYPETPQVQHEAVYGSP